MVSLPLCAMTSVLFLSVFGSSNSFFGMFFFRNLAYRRRWATSCLMGSPVLLGRMAWWRSSVLWMKLSVWPNLAGDWVCCRCIGCQIWALLVWKFHLSWLIYRISVSRVVPFTQLEAIVLDTLCCLDMSVGGTIRCLIQFDFLRRFLDSCMKDMRSAWMVLCRILFSFWLLLWKFGLMLLGAMLWLHLSKKINKQRRMAFLGRSFSNRLVELNQ